MKKRLSALSLALLLLLALCACGLDTPAQPEDGLTVSASRKDGRTFVSIGNLSCEQEAEITLCPAEGTLPDKGTLRLLTAQDMHAHNTFEEPDTVTPVTRQVNPNRPLTLPPFSVCTLTF